MQFWYNYIVNVFGRIKVFMKENVNKQLSLSQRTRIEEMLNQRKRKFEIANELDKYFYIAEKAHKQYKYTLTDARQGVNLNTTELIELAHLICPLKKKGQSIYTILTNHPEIKFCEKNNI